MPRCESCQQETLLHDAVPHGVVALPCGHLVHGRCLLEWVTSGYEVCPADNCQYFVSMPLSLPLRMNKSEWQQEMERQFEKMEQELERKKRTIARLRKDVRNLEDEVEELKRKKGQKSLKKKQPSRKNSSKKN